MRETVRFFLFSCKRVLKKPLFVVLLILVPLGMGFFRGAEQADEGEISIALYMAGDAWNETVAKTLLSGEGSFSFYETETEEALREDVAAGRAECGYIFPADLREKLERGDYRRSIRLVRAPSTVADSLSSEVVFAGLFEVYGRELLQEYGREGEAFAALRAEWGDGGADPVWAEMEPLYDQYRSNGSTFSFTYETINGGTVKEGGITAVFPVRGIGAVFLFVMGLAAAVMAGEDASRGLFAAITAGRRRRFMAAEIGALVFLAGLSVFCSLLLSGNFRGFWRELWPLAVYGAMTAAFSWLLLALIRKPLAVAGTIPFFILGSLAACPVFVDLAVFVPVLGALRPFFLPWYYLMM